MKILKSIVLVLLMIVLGILSCIAFIPTFNDQVRVAIQIRRLSSSPYGISGWDAEQRLYYQIGKPAVTQLIWATRSRNADIRAKAIYLLALIGSNGDFFENAFEPEIERKVKPVFLKLLEDSNEKVRTYVASVLAMMGKKNGKDDPRILPILIEAFKSDSEEIWHIAGKTLSYIRGLKVVDEYVEKIILEKVGTRGQGLYFKRLMAASIIGNTGSDESLDLLTETFGEFPHGLPELINAGNIKALERWRKGLTSPDKSTRLKAFGIIFVLRNIAVVKDIYSLLHKDFPGYEGLSDGEIRTIQRRCLVALELLAKSCQKQIDMGNS